MPTDWRHYPLSLKCSQCIVVSLAFSCYIVYSLLDCMNRLFDNGLRKLILATYKVGISLNVSLGY